MCFEAKLFLEVTQSSVEHLIYTRWATDPDLIQVLAAKLLLNVVRSPARQLWTVGLREPHRGLKAVQVELFADFNKSFNQVQTNGLLSVLERAVEVEFELRAVEILDLGWNLVFWKAVLDDKMSDQIQEDKRASASAESNVVTDWLQLESLAHWTLDCVSFCSVESLTL